MIFELLGLAVLLIVAVGIAEAIEIDRWVNK
jgi:hypothetical protein